MKEVIQCFWCGETRHCPCDCSGAHNARIEAHRLKQQNAAAQQNAGLQGWVQQTVWVQQAVAMAAQNAQAQYFQNQIVESATNAILKKRIAELEEMVRTPGERILAGADMPFSIQEYDRRGARIEELEKQTCSLEYVDREKLRELVESEMGYRRRSNTLADECGRLKDENTQLLAENARLRRGR